MPQEFDSKIGINEASAPQMDGGRGSGSVGRVDKLITAAHRCREATRLVLGADIDKNIERYTVDWLKRQLEHEIMLITEG